MDGELNIIILMIIGAFVFFKVVFWFIGYIGGDD